MTDRFKFDEHPEELEVRIHGAESLPALIYLPGLHGDWTLVGSFRRFLQDKVRFIEVTYPRTLTWSLDDYARALEVALRNAGITRGWFLAESFSSLVLWPLLGRKPCEVEGVILVGGFARHPLRWGARLAKAICGILPLAIFRGIFLAYGKLARFRFRHSSETQKDMSQFIARRTELDRQAMNHRLRLVAEADFCSLARGMTVPVYAMTGLFDPIVPWFPVRRWLRNNCACLREYKIIGCDHNVLGNAPETAAKQVLRWIGQNAAASEAPTSNLQAPKSRNPSGQAPNRSARVLELGS